MVKEKKESKVTASFRVNPEIMQLLRGKNYPLSDVVQASLIHFLNMSDADKFLFLKTYDIQNMDFPNFINNYSGENWDIYEEEITYDVSLRKLLTLVWQSEETIGNMIDDLLLDDCADIMKKEYSRKTPEEVRDIGKKIFTKIINNFNKIYEDCPLKIKNSLVKYLIVYTFNQTVKDDSHDLLQLFWDQTENVFLQKFEDSVTVKNDET